MTDTQQRAERAARQIYTRVLLADIDAALGTVNDGR